MTTQVVPFMFESSPIRVIVVDNEPMFFATDIAVAFGKEDDFFSKELFTCMEALFCYNLLGGDIDFFDWIQFVGKFGHNQPDCAIFSHAYRAAVARQLQTESRDYSEYAIVDKFKKNISTYIPGASITEGPTLRNHIPDAWIKLPSGDICPVEAKRTKADKSALSQLIRYMRVFNRSTGILVAKTITITIPDNVVFVGVME